MRSWRGSGSPRGVMVMIIQRETEEFRASKTHSALVDQSYQLTVNQDVKGERAPEHLQLLAARRRELAYHTTQEPEPTLDSGLWRYGTWPASRDAEEGCGQTRSHEGLRGAMGREGESSPRGPNTRSQRAAAAGGSKRAVMASPFSETPRRFLEGS